MNGSTATLTFQSAGSAGWKTGVIGHFGTEPAQVSGHPRWDVSGGAIAAVISVAALDSKGALASFSSWNGTRVDLAAPGVGILSTLPGRKYGLKDGTSMATPHVTGACALYLSAFPGTSPLDIKSAILNSAIPTTSLAGKTLTGGRLNVGGFYVP